MERIPSHFSYSSAVQDRALQIYRIYKFVMQIDDATSSSSSSKKGIASERSV